MPGSIREPANSSKNHTMAATPPKKMIVNPTLVRVDAGGAAGGSQKSGKELVKTDVF